MEVVEREDKTVIVAASTLSMWLEIASPVWEQRDGTRVLHINTNNDIMFEQIFFYWAGMLQHQRISS